MDSSANLVDQVTYGPQQPDMGYARVPNGSGSFVIQDPTFDINNNPPLHIGFHANNASGCSPLMVNFQNTSLNAVSYTWTFGDSSNVDHTVSPNHQYANPGTYVCSLIANSLNDSDTLTATIQVFAGPGFSFPADTVSTVGTTYLLSAGNGFTNYTWSTGATTESITVNLSGLYCVSVSNINNCSDSDCVYVIVGATGINAPSGEFIYVYPNPANDYFIIGSKSSKIKRTEVYNAMGEIVSRKEFAGSLIIHTDTWSEGFYFVKAGDEWTKIVVKH
jgi:PKD repeat protein